MEIQEYSFSLTSFVGRKELISHFSVVFFLSNNRAFFFVWFHFFLYIRATKKMVFDLQDERLKWRYFFSHHFKAYCFYVQKLSTKIKSVYILKIQNFKMQTGHFRIGSVPMDGKNVVAVVVGLPVCS